MRVTPIPCLSDNYAYLVVCPRTNEAAVVDPSEEMPVVAAIEAANVKLRAIWCTHHHGDHVGGNEAIAARYGVGVFGHASDRGRIPAQTRFLESGDTFELGSLDVRVVHIPGHTLGAIAYVVGGAAQGAAEPPAVFTGDTLFLGGCGRMFEGTPAQMHASLATLGALDGGTLVYCGHEYTRDNLRFAQHVEPDNAALSSARARAENVPSVPGTIAEELATNPFLRTRSAAVRETLGLAADADDVAVFAALRKAKDTFR